MNKRIRKKQFKRTLHKFVATYDEYKADRKRAFSKALQDTVDAQAKPSETIQSCIMIASLIIVDLPMRQQVSFKKSIKLKYFRDYRVKSPYFRVTTKFDKSL